MSARRVLSLVMSFRAPRKTIGDLDANTAASLIEAATDVALVVDEGGVIRDMAIHSQDLSTDMTGAGEWLGRPWIETVALDSRPKVEALLRDATSSEPPGWRHVNQLSAGGSSIPILYSAAQVGDEERVVAFGRDLRAISALQQRLVDAQASMERDYSRLRNVEARYRLLFEMAAEPVLVVEMAGGRVTEANPASRALFGDAGRGLVGRAFAGLFAATAAPEAEAMLARLRNGERADDVRLQMAEGQGDAMAFASLFRQEGASFCLVRLAVPKNVTEAAAASASIDLAKAVASAPDGFVVTEPDGTILAANAAFLAMAQLGGEVQARGERLDRWLGQAGVELDLLIANLRQRGSVRLFATMLRGEFGEATAVEVSAVQVPLDGGLCLGFAIRDTGARLATLPAAGLATLPKGRESALPRSVEQLTELIGRVSLKDLVREATDMIERLCIEAALELSGDNRASAADMLGLSRQSLYVKLRRYGLGDLAEEGSRP